jgi:hypothetical protein
MQLFFTDLYVSISIRLGLKQKKAFHGERFLNISGPESKN